MERDVVPMHSSTPPFLDDYAEVGSEEENVGDFDSLARGASRLPYPEPPCSLRQPSSSVLPTTSAPENLIKLSCRIGPPQEADPVNASNAKLVADHSLPASPITLRVSKVQEQVKGQSYKGEPSSSLEDDNSRETSGYTASVTKSEYLTGNRSPNEQSGFADFSVFMEPVLHPWCCGFTPVGGGSPWEPGKESTLLTKAVPEPGSCRAVDKQICTEVHHCEQRVTMVTQQAQDHHHYHSQEPVTVIPASEQICRENEETGESRTKMHGSCQGFKPSQALELEPDREFEEESFSSLLPQTGSEPPSEDFASFCDIVSPDGLLEDFGDLSELELACLTSQKELTEELWEKMEPVPEKEVEENFENCRDVDSLNRDVSDHNQSQIRKQSESNQSAKGRPDDLNMSDSMKLVEEGLAVLKEDPYGGSGDSRPVQELDEKGGTVGALPPSDSFADFCSAPMEDNSLDWEREGDESWEECGEQAPSEGKTGSTFPKGFSTEESESIEEEGGRWQEDRTSLPGPVSSRVHKLLRSSFPEVTAPVEQEEVEDIPSLSTLLHAPGCQPDDREERTAGVLEHSNTPPPPNVQQGLWQQPQEVHDAVGLRFQWAGSHSNRTLLRCLDIDTRNVLFIGQKKNPVIVPAFAANLGMLEPTKEPLQTVPSARQALTTAQASPASQETRDLLQEAHPLSEVNWSSGGLSNPQDANRASSELDLDCFGSMDGGSTSSICGSTTPPGLDPGLFELTTAKVDSSYDNSHLDDGFNRLMSTLKGTSTFVRKPHDDQGLSEEAIRVLHGLSDFTFMQATVLMFPSILTSK